MGESQEGRTPEPKGSAWIMLAAAVVGLLAILGGHVDLPVWPFG